MRKASLVSTFTMASLVWMMGGLAAEGSGKAEKPKLALDGDCPVCLAEMGKAMKGKAEFKSVHEGFEYRFPSEKQKAMFDADPAKYAVADGGKCVVCKVNMNKDVPGKPDLYAVHNKKIYLFANDDAKKAFEKDPAKYTGEKATEGPKEGSGRRHEGS